MTNVAALDAERRAALRAAKLRALVRTRFGDVAAEPLPFPGGAAVVDGERGFVLLDDDPERSLGRALAWADQRAVSELHLVVDRGAGVLARRSEQFAVAPSVWQIDGRELRRAEAAPPARPVPPPAGVESLIELLRAADLEVVVEHGEIVGELLGLAVARVVGARGSDSGDEEPAARLEVGVGRHDREAFALLHGDLPAADALASVVAAVRRHRRPGGDGHPLNRLAGERWLRDLARREPWLVGMAELRPAEPAVRPASVKEVSAAIAVGRDEAGDAVVVAFSTGIDLDVVPSAADARLMHAPDARLVIVVPERDAHLVTRRLAAALARPADVVTVPGDWRR